MCSLCNEVVSDESLSDELLYGRAGYLYSLLFVKNHLGDETVSDPVLEQVLQLHFASWLNASGELLKVGNLRSTTRQARRRGLQNKSILHAKQRE